MAIRDQISSKSGSPILHSLMLVSPTKPPDRCHVTLTNCFISQDHAKEVQETLRGGHPPLLNPLHEAAELCGGICTTFMYGYLQARPSCWHDYTVSPGTHRRALQGSTETLSFLIGLDCTARKHVG